MIKDSNILLLGQRRDDYWLANPLEFKVLSKNKNFMEYWYSKLGGSLFKEKRFHFQKQLINMVIYGG